MKTRTIKRIKDGFIFGFNSYLKIIWESLKGLITKPFTEIAIKKYNFIIAFIIGFI